MDRMYLKTTIENLEKEKQLHPLKFGKNPAHQNCLPNFDQAIARLQTELNKFETETPDTAAASISDVG